MTHKYIHGYSSFENNRLNDQAKTLDSLLHHDTIFPKGSQVLEVGCGVGAQTEIICLSNPDILLTSIDISADSLRIAADRCQSASITNVKFLQADVYNLPFENQYFDHIFICFVLEHLPDVDLSLQKLRSVLKIGGSLTVIEGDHGSAYYYPSGEKAQKTINCLISLQAEDGGDSLIGRSLYPLLNRNGYKDVTVSPRNVYADASTPEMVDGFTLKTFIAMVEGVREKAIANKLITSAEWELGIHELRKSAESNGVFCYTFFKAKAFK